VHQADRRACHRTGGVQVVEYVGLVNRLPLSTTLTSSLNNVCTAVTRR